MTRRNGTGRDGTADNNCFCWSIDGQYVFCLFASEGLQRGSTKKIVSVHWGSVFMTCFTYGLCLELLSVRIPNVSGIGRPMCCCTSTMHIGINVGVCLMLFCFVFVSVAGMRPPAFDILQVLLNSILLLALLPDKPTRVNRFVAA